VPGLILFQFTNKTSIFDHLQYVRYCVRAGSVVQVVDYLPIKFKVLVLSKKKEKRKKGKKTSINSKISVSSKAK
jgi:hypothetical protein